MQFGILEVLGGFFVFKLLVILLLVVRGSEVFLPTPPSWLLPALVFKCGKKEMTIPPLKAVYERR